MPYYRVPVDYAGPPVMGRVRRRVIGWEDAAQNAVICDRTPGAMWALLWSPDAIPEGKWATKLADGKEERLSTATRAVLSAAITDRAFRSDQAVTAAVTDLLRRPPAAWRAAALRPNPRTLQYEIWLGEPNPDAGGKPLFFREGVQRTKHSQYWEDDFAGDGNMQGRALPVGGSTWNEISGTAWLTTGGRARATWTGEAEPIAFVATPCDTDDEIVEAVLATFTANGSNRYVNATLWAACNSGRTSGYLFACAWNGYEDDGERMIIAIDADAVVGAIDTSTHTTSGTIRFERLGSTVEGFVDGISVRGPYTDTGEPSGSGNRYIGIGAYSDVSGETVEWESFRGGDYPLEGGGGGGNRRRRVLLTAAGR